MISIVVIGAGFSGATFCMKLSNDLQGAGKDVHISLIEKQDFIFNPIGAPRALIEPSFVSKLFIPLKSLFANNSMVTLIQGQVDEVKHDSVTYRKIDGEQLDNETLTLPFDYLVVATGSTYPSPIKPKADILGRAKIEETYMQIQGKIKDAKRILIVGGGSVGVELAGEIASKYPKKKIQLLDANNELVAHNNVLPKFREKVSNTLEILGVELLLGEKMMVKMTESSFTYQSLETKTGRIVNSDIQLVCAGSRPSTFIMEKLDSGLLSDSGLIKVLPTMQLADPRFSNIFVLGDASDHATPKLAYWGMEQAKHLSKSLAKQIISGTTFTPFPPIPVETIITPIGPNHGVSQLPLCGGIVLGNTFTSMVKGKDMFASRIFGMFDTPVP